MVEIAGALRTSKKSGDVAGFAQVFGIFLTGKRVVDQVKPIFDSAFS